MPNIEENFANKFKPSIDNFFKQMRQGYIDRNQFSTFFAALLTNITTETQGQERESVEALKQQGIESLTTDTSGHRSAQWFLETGLAFSSGVATSCFSFIIIHPQIGMAASHKNPVTIERAAAFADKTLEKPDMIEMILKSQDPVLATKLIVQPQDLADTMQQTIQEAFGEFSQLSESIPVHDTILIACGVNWLDPRFIKGAGEDVISMIRKLSLLNDGQARQTGRKFTFKSNIGKPSSVIYGGPNHTTYSKPAVYTFSA